MDVPSLPYREGDGYPESKQPVVRGLQRAGGCHENCGACCEYLLLPLDPRIQNDPGFEDYKKWVRLHGIIILDNLKAYIPIACSALDEDKKCSLYGTEARPDMCGEGPRLPTEILGLEEACTYTWRKIHGKGS